MRYTFLLLQLFFSISAWSTNPPNSISPSNNAQGQPTRITIDWSSMVGSTGYLYELDTTPNFNSSLLQQGSTLSNSSSITISNLYFGTTYYWRAATIGATDTSTWGTTWDFTTHDNVTNVSPTDMAPNQPTTVTIDWSSVVGSNGYIYQVDTSPLFNSPLSVTGTAPFNSSQKVLGSLFFGTTYYWRVATTNANDTSQFSNTWSFTTHDNVTNVSPADMATSQPTTVTIDWSSVIGSHGYIYQVDTSPLFNSPLFVTGTAPFNSSQKVLGSLFFGTTYYWRVATTNANDTSQFGDTWSFTTHDNVTNISPADMATSQPTTVTIDWSSVIGSHGYIYQVDTSPFFNSPLSVTGTAPFNSSQKVLGSLFFGTTYYWRVATTNANDTSQFGDTWSFTTHDNVTNISPADMATNQPTTVTIDWFGVVGSHGYIYQVDTSPLFSAPIFLTGTAPFNSSETILNNLSYGTTYYWRVATTNANDTSQFGDTWSFTTQYQLNNAPLLISPTNGLGNLPTNALQLVWDSVTSASSYQLQYSTQNNFASNVQNIYSATTSKNLNNLNSNTTYYWRVRANNGSGYSPWSTVWSFTTLQQVPNAPTLNSPVNMATNIPIDSLQLLWNAVATATDYQIEYSTDPNFASTIQSLNSTSTTSTIYNLNSNTTYYWRVRANNSSGYSPWSTVWSFTTLQQVPNAPTLNSPANMATNIPIDSLQLLWNAVATATDYQIEYSTDPNFASIIQSINSTSTANTIYNLSSNTTYYWRVRANNGSGYSPWSTVWSFTTQTIQTQLSKTAADVIEVYPNPVQDVLFVQSQHWAASTITLYNLQGQLLQQTKMETATMRFNTHELPQGIYFIEVRRQEVITTFKLIKK